MAQVYASSRWIRASLFPNTSKAIDGMALAAFFFSHSYREKQ
jgi:hypothetical protein